jgi:hypothetical protein
MASPIAQDIPGGAFAYLFPADRNQSIISSGEVPEGRSPRRRRPKQLT